MDIYQPYGASPSLLFDGDWDGLDHHQKHEVAIMSLPKFEGVNQVEAVVLCDPKTDTTCIGEPTIICDERDCMLRKDCKAS